MIQIKWGRSNSSTYARAICSYKGVQQLFAEAKYRPFVYSRSKTSVIFVLHTWIMNINVLLLVFSESWKRHMFDIMQARLWACDLSTPSFGSHFNPILTRGGGNRLCLPYTGVHFKFWKQPQVRPWWFCKWSRLRTTPSYGQMGRALATIFFIFQTISGQLSLRFWSITHP